MLDLSTIASGLTLDPDSGGIWRARRSTAISYPAEGNELCYEIEDRSFWFRHRNACINALIDNFPPPPGVPVFDIGGGNGCVARAIQQHGREVVLVEPGPAGVLNARRRGVRHLVCATIEDARFQPASLPAAGLFDVLEHIRDDLDLLKTLHALLAPGGRLYLTVPAYGALWSREDDHAGHFRRYTLRDLAAKLRAAGFTVDYATYIFRFLPLPILLLRALPWRLGLRGAASAAPSNPKSAHRDHATAGGPISHLIDKLLAAEVASIRQKASLRFGGSCLLAAQPHRHK